jgi:hypothetical protein
MAQIPDWTSLSQATPQPSYRRVQVDDSGAQVAGALENLGTGIERDNAEVHQTNVNFARSQASTALIDHELAVKTQAESIRQQVASGQLPWDQAQPTMQKWQDSQQAPAIDNLDPLGQEALDRGMKRNNLSGTIQVQGIADAGKKQAFADNFGGTLDTLGKLAGMPGADIQSINNQIDAYRPQALEAGIPAATVDKAIQAFKDRNWLNNATQRAMEAKESMPALNQLQHDLTDENGFYAGRLDTDKRNMVLRSVENDQIMLQNRAEHEADKREAKAQSAIGRIDEQISSGIPATPDMWDQWQSQTKGTSFEDDFKQRMKDEDQVQQVLRQPVDQQIKFVQDRAAQLDQQGGTLRDKANLIRLQTAVNQNVNLMEKAPLLYSANRNGTDVQPLDFSALAPKSMPAKIAAAVAPQADGTPGIGQDPKAAFTAQIADRMATLKAMRTQYGSSVQPLPLLPQEAAQLSQQLGASTPPERAQMLVALRDATGDDTAYQSMMRQVAPHSPVTAIAGSMVGASAPAATPAWFSTNFTPRMSDVTHILNGEALLNPASAGGKAAAADQEGGKGALKGGMPMPEDGGMNGLRNQFGDAAGDMFRGRPELADAYYSVFKDAYASLLAEKGDMKGQGDPRLRDQALKIALGNRVQFNGQTVSVPSGMDPSNFQSLVKTAVASTAQQLNAPADWASRIDGYGLREIGALGSGRYMLTMGNQPVTRPDGNGVFTVDMRDQFLGARGLHRGIPDYQNGGDRSPTEQTDFLAAHTK